MALQLFQPSRTIDTNVKKLIIEEIPISPGMAALSNSLLDYSDDATTARNIKFK